MKSATQRTMIVALQSATDSKGKKVEGWIEKEWLCGNLVTTCS